MVLIVLFWLTVIALMISSIYNIICIDESFKFERLLWVIILVGCSLFCGGAIYQLIFG